MLDKSGSDGLNVSELRVATSVVHLRVGDAASLMCCHGLAGVTYVGHCAEAIRFHTAGNCGDALRGAVAFESGCGFCSGCERHKL